MNTAHALPWTSWANDSTGGTSASHSFVANLTRGVALHLKAAQSLSDGRDKVQEDIMAVAESCAKPGWDGYGADAVTRRTLWNARAVIEALPEGMAMPSVGAEADGQITLEWYRNPNWVLSVSVSPEGNLHYAAMLGSARAQGTEQFLGQFPESILQNIGRVRRK